MMKEEKYCVTGPRIQASESKTEPAGLSPCRSTEVMKSA
jgi:hypothetical protein